ncbi:hypothetical protein KC333_g4 [Hortaea werneckii]|nr:hypothetical protein KC333_g4 [Hortaea werneckii]
MSRRSPVLLMGTLPAGTLEAWERPVAKSKRFWSGSWAFVWEVWVSLSVWFNLDRWKGAELFSSEDSSRPAFGSFGFPFMFSVGPSGKSWVCRKRQFLPFLHLPFLKKPHTLGVSPSPLLAFLAG